MTEKEWLTCGDPARMVRSLQGRGGIRKPRLWACAFFRWHRSDVGMLIRAVEAAERWAEGEEPKNRPAEFAGSLVCDRVPWRAAQRTAGLVADWAASAEKELAQAYQLETLRDIFGNPFRPASVDPAWLTTDVVALARGIYEERAFDRMPILADALQDAGCDNDDILNHCRDANQVHVRGCWVIDLLTGRQ